MDGVAITVRMNELAMRGPNPHVPWSPEEIAVDAAACVEAGAAVVHFHGRDPITGAADTSAVTLSRTLELLAEATDAVTYCTLGAGTSLDRHERLAMLTGSALRPDLAPVDLGSFNLDAWDATSRTFASEEGLYVNTVGTVRHLAEGIVGSGVRPTAVVWSIGSLRLLGALVEQGVWPRPVVGELVVSDRLLVTNPATDAGLRALVDFLPDVEASWSVMCGGGSILPLVASAVELGAGLAFGLGDHPYAELGTPTNAEVVRAVVAALEALGRRPATVAEVRAGLA